MDEALITMTTDFGTADGYVGAVKGAMLTIHPRARIVDLSNEIPSYDIVVGSFHLGCAFPYYPKGTVHLAVVDPGVGSARRPILVVTKNHFFVGPDNGLLTTAVKKDGLKAVYELTNRKYWRSELSSTFHGRDLFGPVAAHLARGIEPRAFGPRRQGLKLLKDFDVQGGPSGWRGRILFFDKFGNAFTNIHRSHLKGRRHGSVVWERGSISFYRTYSEIPKGEPGAIFGSAGYLEIALREDSFLEVCDASRFAEILLKKV